MKHHVPCDRLNPFSRKTIPTNATTHKSNKTTCFKEHITIDDLIIGDVFGGKGGSGGADSTEECPTQIYILRSGNTDNTSNMTYAMIGAIGGGSGGLMIFAIVTVTCVCCKRKKSSYQVVNG